MQCSYYWRMQKWVVAVGALENLSWAGELGALDNW